MKRRKENEGFTSFKDWIAIPSTTVPGTYQLVPQHSCGYAGMMSGSNTFHRTYQVMDALWITRACQRIARLMTQDSTFRSPLPESNLILS